MTSKTIRPLEFTQTIDGILNNYRAGVIRALNAATDAAAKRMVSLTKEQQFKNGGNKFRRAISWKQLRVTPEGAKVDVWYVKSPHYRLTHLLEHGHRTLNGGRTVAYGFVGQARNQVENEYLLDIERNIRNVT